MRNFHGLIFLGNGEHSVAAVERLKGRLAEGISELSALQQGNLFATEEENAKEEAAITSELEDVVRDVAAALLGREVSFDATLPYPPPHDPV